MKFYEKIFEDYFNKPSISDQHLYAFAKDTKSRFELKNTNHAYDATIAALTPKIQAFGQDILKEDASTNLRKSKTKTVIQLTEEFGPSMSELESVIARKVGGREKDAFLAIYPNGLTEYSKPSRENMELFTSRIGLASTTYASELGDELAAELKAFETNWESARGTQVNVKNVVDQDKGTVKSNRTLLEEELTKAVLKVATDNIGHPEISNQFFNFNLLFSVAHHPHEVLSGTLAAGATVSVINKTFTDAYTIQLKNTGSNAAWWIWLGATAIDGDNSKAIKVEPEKTVTIKPSDIGDLSKTFLLIKNDSSVNVASWEVTIIG